LPLYFGLTEADQDRVVHRLQEVLAYRWPSAWSAVGLSAQRSAGVFGL